MSKYYRTAYAISTKLVKETCPRVDEVINSLTETVKDCTRNLREALVEKIEENLELQDKIDDLETCVKEQQDLISEYVKEIAALLKQLDNQTG